ncbi:MAG TPA: DUF434 domain-containing protein [Tepidisphaeraceae bacterium]|nr:DUF434 domain-containing protein [Tepidisphaeraceae bacterium]
MPDQRHHRGPHPEDRELFSPDAVPSLRSAASDLSWLLTRGYASPGALKLVGDRYTLSQRQRTAIMRSACPDDALAHRQSHQVTLSDVAGQPLHIDGYNVLTTIETALSHGVILIGRDGCCRDIASIHGTYRKVEETIPALHLAGTVLSQLHLAECIWYLDSPVSNSGRLKTIICQIATEQNWPWQVQIVPNPDPLLAASPHIIATADSVILDGCTRWFNLARHILTQTLPSAWTVDLS